MPPGGTRCRSLLGARLLATLGDVLLMYAVQLQLCLGWKAPQALRSKKVDIVVISCLDGYDSHDFEYHYARFLKDLVDETSCCRQRCDGCR